MVQANNTLTDKVVTIFYDGNCALCHGLVKFALSHPNRDRFRFSPIQGATYSAKFGPMDSVPTTVIVLTANGEVLDRSSAIAAVLIEMGGLYKIMGQIIMLLPKILRDGFYRLVSNVRYKIFGKTNQLCPTLPDDIKKLFLP